MIVSGGVIKSKAQGLVADNESGTIGLESPQIATNEHAIIIHIDTSDALIQPVTFESQYT